METKFKKRGILFSVLLVLGLLATVSIAAGDTVVLGKEVKENISDKYARGKGDGQTIIITPTPIRADKTVALATTTPPNNMVWMASTDLYDYWYDPIPRLNTYSKSRLWPSGIYDIDKIAVRGRVWKNGDRILDKTDTRYRSSDASVYWKYSCAQLSYCGGSYSARGDHTFVLNGFRSVYPVTGDTLKEGPF